MEELIARIATDAGVESGTVKKAVGMILAFLRNEGPKEEVDAVFSVLPGAAEAADAVADEDGGSAAAGGLMGLAGRLGGLGLSMGEMQTIGQHVFTYVRDKAGDECVGQIVSAIPGLGQFL